MISVETIEGIMLVSVVKSGDTECGLNDTYTNLIPDDNTTIRYFRVDKSDRDIGILIRAVDFMDTSDKKPVESIWVGLFPRRQLHWFWY